MFMRRIWFKIALSVTILDWPRVPSCYIDYATYKTYSKKIANSLCYAFYATICNIQLHSLDIMSTDIVNTYETGFVNTYEIIVKGTNWNIFLILKMHQNFISNNFVSFDGKLK